MPLTDVSIRSAKPREKSYRLKDSVGLYLEVRAEGGKWWRFRYRFAGRQKLLPLGTYPCIGASAISDLKPPELLAVFRRIKKRGALETAQRARENVSQVFRYAVATGRAESDPSRDQPHNRCRAACRQAVRAGPRPAIGPLADTSGSGQQR
jgi:integrase